MKKIVVFGLLALSIIAITPACGGKGKDDPKPCSETAMIVSTDPANGSTQAPGIGPNFTLTVNITANLPSAGVEIKVTAAPEAGGAAFYTQTLSDVKTNVSTFTITNTPATTASKVDITVTSKGCNTNKWTGSYRYSKK
ncbi:hypothetical protein [Paraflavitalea pollutisoli]|uniref:hypothetical protein n=1 Tax=Paraflavitalea pollutisoli TaxID=3034143 RepID=UPI0023EC768E|nr:hypothetical protein [Paraflavitalea sp. H1-2-19X]